MLLEALNFCVKFDKDITLTFTPFEANQILSEIKNKSHLEETVAFLKQNSNFYYVCDKHNEYLCYDNEFGKRVRLIDEAIHFCTKTAQFNYQFKDDQPRINLSNDERFLVPYNNTYIGYVFPESNSENRYRVNEFIPTGKILELAKTFNLI
jgi:hypothetical protein